MSRRVVLVVCLLVVAGLLNVSARAAGAWMDQAHAPTLRQRGWRYAVKPLRPGPNTSLAAARINRVSWQYHYARWHRGFQVALCARDICIDATAERGWSDAFAGLPAATTFRFHFMVAGQGMLAAPMRGQELHLIVNFE